MTREDSSELPLRGIRVIDMSDVWAGPATGMYLADQGADVIKVEPPGGDHTRALYQVPGMDTGLSYLALNRNKRGVRLDAKTPAGLEVLMKLIGTADVLVLNMRSRAASKLGLTYDQLNEEHPRLVYCNVRGFGDKGPYAERRGFDLLARAITGILGNNRLPDGSPHVSSVNVCDLSAAMLCAFGITLALYDRASTGRGREVNVSLLGAGIAVQAGQIAKAERFEVPFQDIPRSILAALPCEDGLDLAVLIGRDEVWKAACEALEIEAMIEAPEFLTPARRYTNRGLLFDALREIFGTRPRSEWLNNLHAHDVPAAPVLSVDEVHGEPQLLENRFVVAPEHPRFGRVSMVGLPMRLSGVDYSRFDPAPDLGQHTDEVLRQAGYGDEDIEGLRRAGAI